MKHPRSAPHPGPQSSRPFPFLWHRTMAMVAETEALGRKPRLQRGERVRLHKLLARAVLPTPCDWETRQPETVA